MNKKEKRSARKWFKEFISPLKEGCHLTSFELYRLLLMRLGSVEFTEREFIDFCWSDDRNLSYHATCHGAKCCQVNALEQRYKNFVSEFGRFNKNEYQYLRLALKV